MGYVRAGGDALMSTPLPVIATVSRVVTMVIDRITGDRVDYPLLVATACVEALKRFGIESRVMYGQGAWVEVLEDSSVLWAGCWGESLHFWVATQFGEVVDLNTSVAFKKKIHSDLSLKPQYSPPILWSAEVPRFYRYVPEGIAEIELTEERDQRFLKLVLEEIEQKCRPELLATENDSEFPNEPILCPGRRILDDSRETFKHFDRAILVRGIPDAPI